MTPIRSLICGAALGVSLVSFAGLIDRPATAAPAQVEDRLAREQVQALKEIAAELRALGRECKR